LKKGKITSLLFSTAEWDCGFCLTSRRKSGDLLAKLVVEFFQIDDKEMLEAARKMDDFYRRDVRESIVF
jgi:hypothetical protein